MKEVLFRGKTVSESECFDDGEWMEGFYTCFNGEEHRIYTGYAETDCGDYYPDWFNVVPETVGQYTGLVDKNDKKIFEGDIVIVSQAKKEIAVVKYDERVAAFYFEWTQVDKCNFMLDFYLRYGKFYTNIFEVIGNVYDTPELKLIRN